jgi:hypothetical protein
LATLVAPPARAQTSIELAWDAPPECPQEPAVRARLNSLVGKPAQARRRLQAVGRIEHVGKRYRLTLSVRERGSVRERTMNADSCDDLGGAAAVALGLLIRNERAVTSGEDHPNGTEAAEGSEAGSGSEAAGTRNESGAAPKEAPKTAPLAPAPSKKSPAETKNEKRDEREDGAEPAGITSSENRRWHILLRMPIAAFALGRLPKPSGGIAAGIGASYDEWRLNLTARVLGTQTIQANNAYEAGARVGHRDLELGICRDWRDGRTALAPCVSAELQRESARGRGPGVTPERASSLSVVLAGGLDAHVFLLDWLSLAASVTLGVETAQPQLQVITAGDVKKLGPVELSLGIGPEWIF